MDRRYYCLIAFCLLFSCRLMAVERTYNVLFIQSYNTQTPWHDQLIQGLINGIKQNGIKATVTTEYLDANFWKFESEKVLMKRFCERARERKTDLIVTANDEAFYSLYASNDSLPLKIPVVFFGIKYPDMDLIKRLPNVCGFTSNPNYFALLEQVNRIFPERKEVICIVDNSFLSNKGLESFLTGWNLFHEIYSDYTMKVYNTQVKTTQDVISAVCYPRNSTNRVVIAPKWTPYLSFVGKNSKAPFFACQNLGLKNGVFCVYDDDAYTSAYNAGRYAAFVLRGDKPKDLGVRETPQGFIYDSKQLAFFKVDPSAVSSYGFIVNESYWERNKLLFMFLYPLALLLLTGCVIWLIRLNRKEAKRRVQVQTRLLIQNKLVEQRDEFDTVLHSIRDAVITYDTELRIHFTNNSLHKLINLPEEYANRPYEGMPAGSIFSIYNNGEDILQQMLLKVAETEQSVMIPPDSFLKETHEGHYFLVSGEIAPIHTKGQMIGMVLSARNISGEEMQERFFDMALEESAIYPWQYDLESDSLLFPPGFLSTFGYGPSVISISRKEMDHMIHPDDLNEIRSYFDKILAGETNSSRLNFRQRNAKGIYEWWEYRSSVIKGMSDDLPYNILGVCQSIQRYKIVEQELRHARDEALRADNLKSAFLANMSHEIRTPLNAIVGFSDLLSDMSSFSQEEIALFIETINKNCTLLLTLINDILDLSRIESGTMEFVCASHSLPLLLKTVYDSQQLNMPPGVELRLDMPENDNKCLITDSIRLQQVVNNLINNATKFTLSGSITVGYEEEAGTDYTRIFVADTGVGISEEGIKHIFERFYKVDNFTQGAGLGLSICQTIVERLHGEIHVASVLGEGTCFSVRIPNICE
ncbi:PAS domain S-box-containing protein [Bacteroides reticulotermitis]|uniref:histidine kinase n=1 Tax=Bacteroides reticulotermitis TaxID=1133319 RepID=A0A840CU85_9BACE|nr:ABC transporter substrate binding protein [Bacteroides reticulotermitis]MBB4043617.1 PAS domain S-box-containing protein [Bacteroides reticulotermitis]